MAGVHSPHRWLMQVDKLPVKTATALCSCHRRLHKHRLCLLVQVHCAVEHFLLRRCTLDETAEALQAVGVPAVFTRLGELCISLSMQRHAGTESRL